MENVMFPGANYAQPSFIMVNDEPKTIPAGCTVQECIQANYKVVMMHNKQGQIVKQFSERILVD
jgi:hypothetical protein